MAKLKVSPAEYAEFKKYLEDKKADQDNTDTLEVEGETPSTTSESNVAETVAQPTNVSPTVQSNDPATVVEENKTIDKPIEMVQEQPKNESVVISSTPKPTRSSSAMPKEHVDFINRHYQDLDFNGKTYKQSPPVNFKTELVKE
jgi:hypothetical protein